MKGAGEIEPATVEAIENHRFDPVRVAQWRNSNLDFGTLDRLLASLDALPTQKGLQRIRPSTDLIALRIAEDVVEIKAAASTPDKVRLLWDVCQVP